MEDDPIEVTPHKSRGSPARNNVKSTARVSAALTLAARVVARTAGAPTSTPGQPALTAYAREVVHRTRGTSGVWVAPAQPVAAATSSASGAWIARSDAQHPTRTGPSNNKITRRGTNASVAPRTSIAPNASKQAGRLRRRRRESSGSDDDSGADDDDDDGLDDEEYVNAAWQTQARRSVRRRVTRQVASDEEEDEADSHSSEDSDVVHVETRERTLRSGNIQLMRRRLQPRASRFASDGSDGERDNAVTTQPAGASTNEARLRSYSISSCSSLETEGDAELERLLRHMDVEEKARFLRLRRTADKVHASLRACASGGGSGESESREAGAIKGAYNAVTGDAIGRACSWAPALLQGGGGLKPYQVLGVNWLILLRRMGLSGLLADEMGLVSGTAL